MSITFPLPNNKIEMAATTYNVLFPEIESATIIGTGNVANWFVYALKKAKIQINQIKCKVLLLQCLQIKIKICKI